MILNKQQLLKHLQNLAKKKKEQAYLLEDLIRSLEQHYKDKPFKDWKKIIEPVIERLKP